MASELLADHHLSLLELSESHIDQIMRLENAAHSHPWSVAIMSGAISRHLGIGLCRIDTEEFDLIGFALVSVVLDEAELLNFVIDPALQGQGMGSIFVESVIDEVTIKAKRFYLEVRQSNIPAIRLYENAGFVEAGVRRNYYPTKAGKEDAILMAMELFQ
jgi:ribosomal-protein-alanine N-acetyltransferase